MSVQEANEKSPLITKRDHPYIIEVASDQDGTSSSSSSSTTNEETPSRCLMSERRLALAKTIVGYGLVIFAGLAFTAANVLQKIIAPNLNFWHLLFYRAIVQMGMMLAVIFGCRTSIMGPRENRTRIFLQGFLGGLLLLCIFVAIKHVPLGNGSAIFFCTPVFTFFFAMFMLNENLGAYRGMISSLMIVGVILITRPPFFFGHDDAGPSGGNSSDFNSSSIEAPRKVTFSSSGYFCAIMVPMLSAIVSILTRQLKHVNAAVLMFWFSVGAFVVACGGIVFTQAGELFMLDGHDWSVTIGIVLLGLLGNGSYTFAVRWVTPSKANVFRSFEVILNFTLQLTLEHTMFHYTNLVGIVFLLLAVLSTGFESEIMRRYAGRYKFL